MADCGIEKYDKLPAVVGWIDVDYLRWRLYRCNNPSWLHYIPIIGWLWTPASSEKERIRLEARLDRAVEIHKLSLHCPKCKQRKYSVVSVGCYCWMLENKKITKKQYDEWCKNGK